MQGDRPWVPGLNRGAKEVLHERGAKSREKKNQSKERNRREQTSPVSIQVGTHLTLTVEETEATMKAAFA